MRLGPPRERSREGVERHPRRPVQGDVVHLVQRAVHQPGEVGLETNEKEDLVLYDRGWAGFRESYAGGPLSEKT
jgi:hypothetical protein